MLFNSAVQVVSVTFRKFSTMKKKVIAVNLGHMSYEAALCCQQEHIQRILQSVTKHGGTNDKLIDRVKDQQYIAKRNRVLLVEHPPVYTVGLRQEMYQSKCEPERLRALGAQYIRTNRGGLITFHGPGQLVIYPILYLKDFNMTIKSYVKNLESTIVSACKRLGVDTETSPDTGVWVGNTKIAAIGVRGSRYVVSHGMALNCNTDLRWFDHIVPCGLVSKGVTSLSRELGRDVTIADAVDPILQAFALQFDCEIEK